MAKIYFITTTPIAKATGGAYMRFNTIKVFEKHGYNIVVVEPDSNPNDSYNKLTIEYTCKLPSKIIALGKHTGVFNSFFDSWILKVCDTLTKIVKPEDTIFCVTGGDLAAFYIGYNLKIKNKCNLVLHYHDPISFCSYNNLKINFIPHKNLNREEAKIVSIADLIITSCQNFGEVLSKKYPEINAEICNWHFGWTNHAGRHKKTNLKDKKFHIAYTGNMSKVQSPERVVEWLIDYEQFKDIQFSFIGNTSINKKLITLAKNNKNVTLIDHMSRKEVQEYCTNKVDALCISLKGRYFGYCIPSKLYDALGWGIPIIGMLPDGEASNIISKNNFGKNTHNREELYSIITHWIKEPEELKKIRNKIEQEQNKWSSNYLFEHSIKSKLEQLI